MTISRVYWGYCCRKHGRKRCYKKTRFYWFTCSDEYKRLYYCYGFLGILQRQGLVSCNINIICHNVLVDCCVCLPSILYFTCWTFFFFLPVSLINHCIVFVDYLNACDDIPFRQLICTGHIHAYDRQLKKGVIWCKKNNCLLNPSAPITYEILLLKQKFMLLP